MTISGAAVGAIKHFRAALEAPPLQPQAHQGAMSQPLPEPGKPGPQGTPAPQPQVQATSGPRMPGGCTQVGVLDPGAGTMLCQPGPRTAPVCIMCVFTAGAYPRPWAVPVRPRALRVRQTPAGRPGQRVTTASAPAVLGGTWAGARGRRAHDTGDPAGHSALRVTPQARLGGLCLAPTKLHTKAPPHAGLGARSVSGAGPEGRAHCAGSGSEHDAHGGPGQPRRPHSAVAGAALCGRQVGSCASFLPTPQPVPSPQPRPLPRPASGPRPAPPPLPAALAPAPRPSTPSPAPRRAHRLEVQHAILRLLQQRHELGGEQPQALLVPAAPARRAPELRGLRGGSGGRPLTLGLALRRRLPRARGLRRRHPRERPADAEFKWPEVTPVAVAKRRAGGGRGGGRKRGRRGGTKDRGGASVPAHRPGPQLPRPQEVAPTWPRGLFPHYWTPLTCMSTLKLLGFLAFCNQKCAFPNFSFFNMVLATLGPLN